MYFTYNLQDIPILFAHRRGYFPLWGYMYNYYTEKKLFYV